MRKCLIPWKSLTRLAEYGYSTDAFLKIMNVLRNYVFIKQHFFWGGGIKSLNLSYENESSLQNKDVPIFHDFN